MSDEPTGRPEPEDAGDTVAGENEALDQLDEAALRGLAAILEAADGPPPGFIERMRFAVASRGLDDELARLTEPVTMEARGADRPTVTWTFEAPSLTVLIAVEPTRRGGLTIDGWLAPGSARTVRLRIADGQERETLTDDAGRFGYADVTPGLVQVVVVAADDRPGVVTPTFEL